MFRALDCVIGNVSGLISQVLGRVCGLGVGLTEKSTLPEERLKTKKKLFKGLARNLLYTEPF